MRKYTYEVDPTSLNDILYRYFLEDWMMENCSDWSIEDSDHQYTVTFNREEDEVYFILSPMSDFKSPNPLSFLL